MKIYQVDAFTQEPFAGNPAGVCLLEKKMSDEWMQNVAREMNLSETAFLQPEDKGFRLRWFTPESEVDLCGHATLASAHILWETGMVNESKQINFFSNSGKLTASRREGGWIELDFPLEQEEESEPPEILLEALGIEPEYVGRNRFDYLLEVESEETVRNLEPDFNLLKKVDTRGVIVTASSRKEEYDFVSRFFVPGIGVDEDPVTGSSHCCLGPYWKKKLGKSELNAVQLSERGGELRVKVLDNGRIKLLGQAVTVLKGELT
ncbi:MAG: PhzF family phenazine biosynthesis protein [Halanaerobiaceae bacterium]